MERGSGDEPTVIEPKFIGVWIPTDDQTTSKDKSCVLLEKPSSLKDLTGLLKRNPRARFLKFSTEEEAWASLEETTEFSSPPTATATLDSPIRGGGGDDGAHTSAQKRRKGRLSLPAMNSIVNNNSTPKKVLGEEKDTRFPTPKIQELTAMAREIAAKNNSAVKARVDANPKMLINDCDLPTTVQEGCRYNSLHIAAKCDNHEIVAYILNKVGSLHFMSILYPNKSVVAIKDQIRYATDAYLNTPDKMSNETPLHFATKFLSVKAAEVLIRHPWCNLDAVNCCNETAENIIGLRADSFSPNKGIIQKLFKAMYIIPIWRDPSGFRMAQLGPVVHIRQLGNRTPNSLMKNFPDFEVSLLGPCQKNMFPESKLSHNTSTRVFEECSQWSIQAYAGPTTKNCADELFSSLKQGRYGFQYDSPIHSANVSFSHANIRSPTTAGGSGYFQPSQTPPRTPRKRISIGNLRSPLFKNHYPGQNIHITPPSSPCQSFSSPALFDEGNHERLKDVEKGLERFAMRIATTSDVEWQENWEWLNFFGSIFSDEGLTKIEDYLKISDFYESRSQGTTSINSGIQNSLELPRRSNDRSASFSSRYLGDESLNLSDNGNNTSYGEPSFTGEIVKMMTRLDLNRSSNLTRSFDLDSSFDDLDRSSEFPAARRLNFGSPTPSDDSFYSAVSDLDNDPFFELTDNVVYMHGHRPGKKDFQLFAVLRDYEDRVSPDKFLLTFQWLNAMKSSGLCDRPSNFILSDPDF